MAEFSIRSDAVDVEQIMRQIRARIREKRGADYTEREIRELANAKLETFLDPSRVRSDLLEQFRVLRRGTPPPPNFAFEDSTIYETHRPFVRLMRRLLNPVLKLFFNPNPIAEALHIQAQLNARYGDQLARFEALYYEIVHNLVVEVTRLGIEVKTMKMKVESVAARLDFDERRGRALEGSVLYRTPASMPIRGPREAASAAPGAQPSTAAGNGTAAPETGAAAERRRRRRRRGRRRGAGAAGGESSEQVNNSADTGGEHTELGGQPHVPVPHSNLARSESELEPDSDLSSVPDDTNGHEPPPSTNEPES